MYYLLWAKAPIHEGAGYGGSNFPHITCGWTEAFMLRPHYLQTDSHNLWIAVNGPQKQFMSAGAEWLLNLSVLAADVTWHSIIVTQIAEFVIKQAVTWSHF